MIELVIHYLANRNHVPIIAALQKNNSSEWRNPVFYSEVIFLSRNMDLNNKSHESVADQRWLKYCLLLKTHISVYFGLSFCSFFNTSILFVTCMPSDLHRWQFLCITSDVFIWRFIWPPFHWQILFHRWGNWDAEKERKLQSHWVGWLETQQKQQLTSSGS